MQKDFYVIDASPFQTINWWIHDQQIRAGKPFLSIGKGHPKELKKSEFDIDNENTTDLQITTIKTGYYKWDSLINLNEKLASISFVS